MAVPARNVRTFAPTFSVVVPTYQRPHALAACLDALAQLDYPTNLFDVIVVDDGGSVDLEPLVAAHRATLRITLVRQPNAGAAAARNTGAAHASGTFVAFTDDDCAPDPGWLGALADAFAAEPEALLGGYTLNALSHNTFSNAAERILSAVYRYYNTAAPTFFASNNIALSRSAFAASGGFDPRFPRAAAEDRDFCDRWLARGGRLVLVREARVRHLHPLSLRTFCTMYFNYGRGAYHYQRLRARRQRRSMRIDAGFHLTALRDVTQAPNWFRRAQLTGLFVTWQVANAAGFASEMVAARARPTSHFLGS